MEWIKGDFRISTDKNLLNVRAIHSYLSKESYWAMNISEQRVQKSCENSLCFGVYNGTEQIGFARAITDYATFSYLADVYILPAYQGKGLGKWLMECIMAHPDLQELRRWILATKDAHGLYEQNGFKPLAFPNRHMEYKNTKVFDTKWLID
jgi:GNAT superfamily N-acetyltransferase